MFPLRQQLHLFVENIGRNPFTINILEYLNTNSMIYKYLSLLIIISSVFSSCSKDDDLTFFEVTIDGKTYSDDSFTTGYGYYTEIGLIEGFESFITMFNVPEGEFEAYFLHYKSSEDFETTTGSYKIAKFDTDPDYKDKSLLLFFEYYDLEPQGVNNVTSIKEINKSSDEITYRIKGNFSCSFSDDQTTISVKGKYQFPIYVNIY